MSIGVQILDESRVPGPGAKPPPDVQLQSAAPPGTSAKGATSAQITQRITQSAAWQDPANQAMIIRIATVVDVDGYEALAQLCEDPDKLRSVDAYGHTLLENLDRLATQPLNEEIVRHGGGEATRSKLVSSTLQDVANPGANVTQNRADTCSTTATQIMLATQQPAEYVRLLVGLTGEEGSVRMRGGGELSLQKESFKDGGIVGDEGRTPSEVIFQGAAIEFATGPNLRYNAAVDGYEVASNLRYLLPDVTSPFAPLVNWGANELLDAGTHKIKGISSGMQANLLENLFGRDYATLFGDGNLLTNGLARMGASEGERAYQYLVHYNGDLPVELTYRFLDASTATGSGHSPSFSNPVETGRWLGQEIDRATQVHSVVFDHVDPATGRVYFQNPWGDKAPGDYRAGHVDPAQPGLFYLTHDEFVNNVIWVVGPTGEPYPPPAPPMPPVPTGTTSTTTTVPGSAPPPQPAPAAPPTTSPGPPTGTTTTTTIPTS